MEQSINKVLSDLINFRDKSLWSESIKLSETLWNNYQNNQINATKLDMCKILDELYIAYFYSNKKDQCLNVAKYIKEKRLLEYSDSKQHLLDNFKYILYDINPTPRIWKTHFVTMFIDIGIKGADYYFDKTQLFDLPISLTIIVDEKNLQRIPKRENINIIQLNFDQLEAFKYLEKIEQNRKIWPSKDLRNTSKSFCLYVSKFEAVKKALDKINESQIAWIDFGLKEKITIPQLCEIDDYTVDKFKLCLIHYRPKDFVMDRKKFYQFGYCSIAAGFMVGSKNSWKSIINLVYDEFKDLVNYGCGHGEEQIITTIYTQHPEYFDLYYGDYELLIRNYNYIYTKLDQIIELIIKPSIEQKNFQLTINVIETIIKSIKYEKLPIETYSKISEFQNLVINHNLIIGVMACCDKEKYIEQMEACKKTWFKGTIESSIPTYFFTGEVCGNYKCKNDKNIIHLKNVNNDFISSTYKQWYGLKYMYESHPNAKFYFLIGTDTYIQCEKLLSFLKDFDYTDNLYIGGHGDIKLIHDENIYFHSGGSGFILSNSLMKEIYKYIPQWIDQWFQLCNKNNLNLLTACDVSMAYLIYKYKLGKTIKTEKFRGCNWKGFVNDFKCCGTKIKYNDLLSCHYMNPSDMDEMHKLIFLDKNNNY